jgi:WD40 repeat protein
MTSSLDGSVRLWDLLGEAAFGNLVNKHVLKIRGLTGQSRVGATACCFSPDGEELLPFMTPFRLLRCF